VVRTTIPRADSDTVKRSSTFYRNVGRIAHFYRATRSKNRFKFIQEHWRTQEGRGLPGFCTPESEIKIKHRFCRHDFYQMFYCDLGVSLNQLLKSADDKYIGILKNIINTYEYAESLSFFS
jgi:hypothetical protein